MRTLCDQLALLEHGNLVDVGEAGHIVDEYMTDVHEDRVADGTHGTRWGSGEGRITLIELLDESDRPVTTVRTGDAVTFRFHYELDEPFERPVFGMALHTVEGVHVTGPNTRDAGFVPERLDGSGHVDLKVDKLLLVRGIYDVSASLVDYSCLHTYDFRHRSFRFDVERGHPEEQFGVVSLGGTWGGLPVEVRQ
jgi:ABC-2 type transport system ATP-binding protein